MSKVTLFKDKTPYCLLMKWIELFRRVPAGYGLVINPGYSNVFELPPDVVQEILNDFTE